MEHILEPNVSFTVQFEKDFSATEAMTYMNARWHHSIYYSIVYILGLYFGRQYMSDKPAFYLRTPLMIWSGCLAVFSIFGTLRMTPRFIYLLTNYGVFEALCHTGFLYNQPTSFWAYIFAISKVYELGDTAFIVLRKQKLTFLHWYHHITVFCYCWYSYQRGDSSTGLVFSVMNFTVHAVMYSYYTLKAMKIPVPRQISMVITALQLIQMFIGVSVTFMIHNWKGNGLPCNESYNVIYLAMVMYGSYLLLFANFFYQTYVCKKSSKPKDAKEYSNGAVSNKKD